MTESVEKKICFTQQELTDLLEPARRRARTLGWLSAFLSAVLAALLGPLLYDMVHYKTQAERDAENFKQQADIFYSDVHADKGLRNSLAANAGALNQRAINLGNAMVLGQADKVQQFEAGVGRDDGLASILSAYLTTINDIDRAVARASQAADERNGPFAPYRKLLAGTAQDDSDCLTALANSYTPSTVKGLQDIRCKTKHGRYYLLADRLSYLDACESVVGNYLDDASQQLSNEAVARVSLANPYTLPAMWRWIILEFGGSDPQHLQKADWPGLTAELNEECISNAQGRRTYGADDPRISNSYPPSESKQSSTPEQTSVAPAQSQQIPVPPTPAPATKCGFFSHLFGSCPSNESTNPPPVTTNPPPSDE